jgi:hypothetical protein
MNNELVKSTSAWSMFTLVTWGIAAAMSAGGIYFLEASFAAKGFYAMSTLMLVHTTVSLTKTLRDSEENAKMINKLEEARTEELLMKIKTA